MSVYFVANIRIDDPEEYQKYLDGSAATFEGHGGRYLAVDGAPSVLEGSWDYSRAVLIEFPTREALDGWYRSDAYQQLLRHRLRAAECDTIVVAGED